MNYQRKAPVRDCHPAGAQSSKVIERWEFIANAPCRCRQTDGRCRVCRAWFQLFTEIGLRRLIAAS